MILFALSISFPELVKSISFVATVRAPDVEVGNVMGGGCMVNLSMLPVIDSCADGCR